MQDGIPQGASFVIPPRGVKGQRERKNERLKFRHHSTEEKGRFHSIEKESRDTQRRRIKKANEGRRNDSSRQTRKEGPV